MVLPPDDLAIALGGNLGGEAEVHLRMQLAMEALSQLGPVRASAVYRTEAIVQPGAATQADYLNAVLRIRATAPLPLPLELVSFVLELERMLGRVRDDELHWGPRAIDLDVLWLGPTSVDVFGPPPLQLPHPRLHARRFVLIPLRDLYDGTLELPGTGVTLDQAIAAAPATRVELTQLTL